MVIKRAGLKVVNNVLFLSKITFECSSKTILGIGRVQIWLFHVMTVRMS